MPSASPLGRIKRGNNSRRDASSIKIRTAQIKSAHTATQLAPSLLQLRRAVRAHPRHILRGQVCNFLANQILRNRLPLAQAHQRTIPSSTPPAQVETCLRESTSEALTRGARGCTEENRGLVNPTTKAFHAETRTSRGRPSSPQPRLYAIITTSGISTPGCRRSISTYSPSM